MGGTILQFIQQRNIILPVRFTGNLSLMLKVNQNYGLPILTIPAIGYQWKTDQNAH
ncbi:hypothetical protein ES708_30505 [subsurface metagenome]